MENTTIKVFNKVTILVFLIGIVVGFGSASLWLRRSKNLSAAKEMAPAVSEEAPVGGTGDKTTENTPNASLAVVSAALSGGKNSLSVDDQKAGDTVNIASVMVDNDAWVAVHEDNGGKPGRILGAQLFRGGTHSGTVDLLRGTVAGGAYYAMLHADDGDHAFDAAKDMPIKDTDGNPVMVKFTAAAAQSAK